ncbi:DNA gyrase subunit B [Phyllobacterium sp. 21LDTY02-6]|jgi:ElaB/YqjD/DUF883 family membrane-anchored ribosome-binding protein|uniref:DUF883 family protein n=1 Tax=unclassified Phyllobacterium TaxID=2638441 RepID=UPI002020C4D0|nr:MULTISPECIES: DNA gyrase subunit B [unclassified Phyllobacterium]MCO4317485.1 DNA gyrase subunit B [Phyllobacterium sp. 21LDTY02-6]MCX8293138.1 DNA gyrase subunit B [Phyllobacterium sp. 0TCS1.6A]
MATVSSKIDKAVKEAQTDQDLQAQVAALKEDIANIAATLSRIGKDSTRGARANAAETLETARLKGEEALDDLRLRAKDLEEQLAETVRENPLTTVAVAAGIGFLLACLTRR